MCESDKKNSPVGGELLVTHHELQVVDDHMADVIDVDSMLHRVYYRPGRRSRDSNSQLQTASGHSRRRACILKILISFALLTSHSLETSSLSKEPWKALSLELERA